MSTDSTNCRSKTVFSTHDWESEDGEGQLYALFYATLWETWAASADFGIWEGVPCRYQGMTVLKKKKNDIPLHFLLKSALTSSQRKSVKLWNIKRLNDHSLLLISPDICQHLLQCYTTYETSQPETLSHTQPTAASTMAQWPRKKWQLQDMTSGGDTAGLAPQYLCP